MESNPLVRLQNLNIKIQGRSILSDLSLSLEKGKIYGLIGRNGAGKTQLLRAISKLSHEYTQVEGDLQTPAQIGFVFQKPALFPWMTVKENLLLINPDEKDRVHDFLKEFGILNYQDFYPFQLSIGTQQKVNVIRAFLFPGQLVLMDEPFSALDLPQKNDLISLIQKICGKDRSILLVTHDIDEALVLSHEIFFLSRHEKKISRSWKISDGPQRTLSAVRNLDWAQQIYSEAQQLLERDVDAQV